MNPLCCLIMQQYWRKSKNLQANGKTHVNFLSLVISYKSVVKDGGRLNNPENNSRIGRVPKQTANFLKSFANTKVNTTVPIIIKTVINTDRS